MKIAITGLITSLGLVLAGGAALAHPMSASAPMGAASMPHECKAKHDHGAERSAPSGAMMNCAMNPAESALAPAKKKVKPHDHAKSHKNQG